MHHAQAPCSPQIARYDAQAPRSGTLLTSDREAPCRDDTGVLADAGALEEATAVDELPYAMDPPPKARLRIPLRMDASR